MQSSSSTERVCISFLYSWRYRKNHIFVVSNLEWVWRSERRWRLRFWFVLIVLKDSKSLMSSRRICWRNTANHCKTEIFNECSSLGLILLIAVVIRQRASQMSIKPRAPRPKNIKKVICAQKERKMSELSGSEIEWALYLDKSYARSVAVLSLAHGLWCSLAPQQF